MEKDSLINSIEEVYSNNTAFKGGGKLETYFTIILRTILMYVIILLIFRFMGKREIGELSILDLVVFIMIAEMAVVSIENTETSIFQTLVPMLLLMGTQLLLAYISLKNKRFRDLIDGRPSVIIRNGQIDEKEMKKQRYNFDDLLLQLREQKIKNLADVEFAILEPSGKLSVFEKHSNNKEGGLAIPLILDGYIQEENLRKISKTNFWLRQQLREKGYKDIKKISYCSYYNGEFYIDIKDE